MSDQDLLKTLEDLEKRTHPIKWLWGLAVGLVMITAMATLSWANVKGDVTDLKVNGSQNLKSHIEKQTADMEDFRDRLTRIEARLDYLVERSK